MQYCKPCSNNNNVLLKLLLIFVMLNTLIISFLGVMIVIQTDKHSVHPKYGNYIKKDSKDRTCSPWDDCR